MADERYRTILESIDEGFCLFEMLYDTEGRPVDYRWLDTNRAFERHTGLANAVGRRARELVPGLEPHWPQIYGRVAESGRAERFVQGSESMGRWFDVFAFPVGEPEQRQVALLFKDITEQRRAEIALRESGERLRIALEAAELGIWEHEIASGEIRLDARAAAHFGFDVQGAVPAGEVLARIHPEDAARMARTLEEAWDASRSSGRYAVEYRVRHPDGTVRWLAIHARIAFPPGASAVGVGTSQDISARKEIELELQRHAARLREADSRKDEFLAMLSHELRNPLAPIRSSIDILEIADPRGREAREARQVMKRQIAHLTKIVDDLLDVTRVARGKVKLARARVDLGRLAREVGEDYRTTMQSRGLRLELRAPADGTLGVLGDRTRLSQTIGNLLHNAAKFTPKGGEVTLEVAQSADAAEVRVRDTGVGFAPELMPQLFEPFSQAAQTLARAEGGVGLGLALVKGLVELHGGTISGSSAGPGTGAEFVIRLPLAQPALQSTQAPRETRPTLGRRRILVVDDSRDAADSLAMLLRLLGQEVEVAYDGPGALERSGALPPDVVLCDIGLPGMSGYEVARRLRAARGQGVKLIAVSGYAQPEDVAQAAAAGFDAHLAKPPDLAALERLLGTA